MMTCSRLVALLLLIFVPRTTFATVDEMVETFSGEGPFTTLDGQLIGFDNPGWAVRSDDDFERGGLIISNNANPEEEDSDRLARNVPGTGGFVTTIHLRDMDLGELHDMSPLDSGSGLFLTHNLTEEVGQHDVMWISVREPRTGSRSDPDTEWLFGYSTDDGGGAMVPRGPNVLIQIQYDAELSEVVFFYDNDFEDQIAPLQFGPLPYTGPPADLHQVDLVMFSAGDGRFDALLDYWSILPYSSVVGDFDRNGVLDAADLDLLQEALRNGEHDVQYDLNGDELLDDTDRVIWIRDLKQTYLGDANLDGEFASADLVNVFAAGEYEDEIERNSTWATGDWDGNGDFTTSDLVVAFQEGGYEQGPRDAASIPEPLGLLSVVFGLIAIARHTVRSSMFKSTSSTPLARKCDGHKWCLVTSIRHDSLSN